MAGGRRAHQPEDSQELTASRLGPCAPGPAALIVGLVLLKVGVIAFGGPITHVAFMRRELVERRAWLDEKTFLRMFAACNLIPGPSSTELAIFIGYRLAG
jgi:chromate transporter